MGLGKPIQIRLTEAQTEELDRICQKLGMTRSEFVRRNLNFLLNYYSREVIAYEEKKAMD